MNALNDDVEVIRANALEAFGELGERRGALAPSKVQKGVRSHDDDVAPL